MKHNPRSHFWYLCSRICRIWKQKTSADDFQLWRLIPIERLNDTEACACSHGTPSLLEIQIKTRFLSTRFKVVVITTQSALKTKLIEAHFPITIELVHWNLQPLCVIILQSKAPPSNQSQNHFHALYKHQFQLRQHHSLISLACTEDFSTFSSISSSVPFSVKPSPLIILYKHIKKNHFPSWWTF